MAFFSKVKILSCLPLAGGHGRPDRPSRASPRVISLPATRRKSCWSMTKIFALPRPRVLPGPNEPCLQCDCMDDCGSGPDCLDSSAGEHLPPRSGSAAVPHPHDAGAHARFRSATAHAAGGAFVNAKNVARGASPEGGLKSARVFRPASSLASSDQALAPRSPKVYLRTPPS
jgi:hypothetical protein